MTFPDVVRIRQHIPDLRVSDITSVAREEVQRLLSAGQVKRGDSVAVAAGSRGIANYGEIVVAVVAELKSIGANTFVVPAMGSHGAATAEGQTAVLAGYGISSSTLGCEVRSSLETVKLGTARMGSSDLNFDIHFDRHAASADHVIICNRIKPHTGFAGRVESGLLKMMMIGLGKRTGAKIYHQAAVHFSFDEIIAAVTPEICEKVNVLGGIAIVENGCEQTAKIEGVPVDKLHVREAELLAEAKALMPSLPVDAIDVLLVDTIGKNISGTGMDTNVIGRKFNDHASSPGETPAIRRICIRDLEEKSQGNATGIGIAEFCRDSLVDKMDRAATWTNCLTANHPTGGMIPIVAASDCEMLAAALGTTGLRSAERARLVWISNTLELSEMEVSVDIADEIGGNPQIERLSEPRSLPFDAQGNLPICRKMLL
jgi:hypothetical protein